MDEKLNEASEQTTDQVTAPAAAKSTASLVLGILSLIFWVFPLLGFPISIVGLVLAGQKKYTVGLVLNIIGLCLTVANSAIGAYMGYMGATGRM